MNELHYSSNNCSYLISIITNLTPVSSKYSHLSDVPITTYSDSPVTNVCLNIS